MPTLNYRAKWTHDETVLALGMYYQIPFGKVNAHHPMVVELANLMHRTPASLSMKIGNIGRLDPTLRVQGIVGLANGSKMEQVVWDEFDGKPEELSEKYNQLRTDLSSDIEIVEDEVIKTPQGMDGVRVSRYRINQSFFRSSVLSAYDNACCLTGIHDPRLLIASHIKPWAQCQDGFERTDCRNGLCLNSLHDRAFDKGLFTLDDDYRVVLSRRLRDAMPSDVYGEYFKRYEGQKITLPERSCPGLGFIQYHRESVFVEE